MQATEQAARKRRASTGKFERAPGVAGLLAQALQRMHAPMRQRIHTRTSAVRRDAGHAAADRFGSIQTGR
ncbi:hypothetical protein EGY31_12380 [Burkholderia multivorans]|nr:hypothetical protein EGY31_12380 [Burkholderia multivorans]